MIDQPFTQLLVLLGTAVAVVAVFQRLQVPSSLAYLLVGFLLGPHTPGPVIATEPIRVVAELGIVFLLFTIGLNFSLPQLHALRRLVFGLGTGQVVLTTIAVGLVAWLAGLPPAAAFVVGAAFAQSSTTIITGQLLEQGEERTRHGRLGTAMSVFQDVTAVPFVVVIPVLGIAAGMQALPGALGLAVAKAALAFAIVFLAGRWLLPRLFHAVALRRSSEVFTLTALFVSLLAAWTTNALGLSMAFGAFLAGMILGETEFRHQVESSIRPFREVLLGLFFVGIGMLFDPRAIAQVWHLALAAAVALLAIKAGLVSQIVRLAGVDGFTAWRTALLLAVGGEFGFALLFIAIEAGVIAPGASQVALTAILFSMLAGPLLIRYNHALAARLAGGAPAPRREEVTARIADAAGAPRDHVVVCGYGRIGQSVAHVLAEEGISYVALDLDPERVRQAYAAGEPVFYGDAADRHVLEAVGVAAARLVVICHEDIGAALAALHHIRALRPGLPVMVRTRDERHVSELRAAGATEVVPETLEASLMIVAHTLLLLEVPAARVMRRIQGRRADRYRLLRESFRGTDDRFEEDRRADPPEVRPVRVPEGGRAVGRSLAELALRDVEVTALVRDGERRASPAARTRLAPGDAVVLTGPPAAVERAERALTE